MNTRLVLNTAPSELQFISLLGYLQMQCRRRAVSLQSRRTSGMENKETPNSSQQQEHCSNTEMRELIASCETEVQQQNNAAKNTDFDRHKLLR